MNDIEKLELEVNDLMGFHKKQNQSMDDVNPKIQNGPNIFSSLNIQTESMIEKVKEEEDNEIDLEEFPKKDDE